MPKTIERPIYFEGQILGANDLQQSLEYARDENARHERYLHSWGIADGLGVLKQGDDFALQPGYAIDSSGAPIIVPRPIVLDRQQLRDEALLSGDEKGHFPLFIVRAEEENVGEQPIGRCLTEGVTRKLEKFAIRFRRSATGWDENQFSPAVTDGPEDADESNRVVLIGFVEWTNEGGGKIVGFAPSNNGILPRYSGVRADDILGRGGTLTLRTRSPKTTDSPMMVVDHHSEKKTFVLGLDDGSGRINEVFTVDAKGNVKAKGDINAEGTLKGTLRSGEITVESGIACDGVTLPLPSRIKHEDVDKGLALHVIVTPRIDASTAPTSGQVPLVIECSVDETRKVTCTIRWFTLGAAPNEVDVAGSVDYLILATVAASEEVSL